MFNEKTWRDGEKLAQIYMKNNGYKILYTNFSCVGVELDIVAILPKKTQKRNLKIDYLNKIKDDKINKKLYKYSLKNMMKEVQDILVITEVKSRVKNQFGKGFEAVDERKQRNIIRGARFLQKNSKLKNMQLRFDVASVDDGKITYIENAFWL